jgi:hypothetical protein
MTEPDSSLVGISRRQALFADWMTDVLVYIIVLNLFVEYADAIVIDSFTISILTAILLKAMLDRLVGLEHRVRAFFRPKEGTIFRVLSIVSVLSILFFGKLLILEVVNFVFGDHVELGHFIDVVALIIAMMAARWFVQWIYERLGPPLPVDD